MRFTMRPRRSSVFSGAPNAKVLVLNLDATSTFSGWQGSGHQDDHQTLDGMVRQCSRFVPNPVVQLRPSARKLNAQNGKGEKDKKMLDVEKDSKFTFSGEAEEADLLITPNSRGKGNPKILVMKICRFIMKGKFYVHFSLECPEYWFAIGLYYTAMQYFGSNIAS